MKPSTPFGAALLLACSILSAADAEERGIAPQGLDKWTVHSCPLDKKQPCIVPIFAWADDDEAVDKENQNATGIDVTCYIHMPHIIDTRVGQKIVFVIGPTPLDFSFEGDGVNFDDVTDEDKGATKKGDKKHTAMLSTKAKSYVTYNVWLKYTPIGKKGRYCQKHGPTIVNRG